MICCSTSGHSADGLHPLRRRRAVVAVAVCCALNRREQRLRAANVYWDVNGTTAGSGVAFVTPDWFNGKIGPQRLPTRRIPPTTDLGRHGSQLEHRFHRRRPAAHSLGARREHWRLFRRQRRHWRIILLPCSPTAEASPPADSPCSRATPIIAGFGNAGPSGGGFRGGGTVPASSTSAAARSISTSPACASLTLATAAHVHAFRLGHDHQDRSTAFQQRLPTPPDARRGGVFTGKWDVQARHHGHLLWREHDVGSSITSGLRLQHFCPRPA